MTSLGLAFDIVEGIIGYSCMAIVVITIPIYLVVVSILYFERNSHSLNSVFCSFYLIGGLLDITSMFNNYLGSIFPARGWFIEYYLSSPTIGQINLMITSATRIGQGFTAFLLAFNRMTAVLMPASYGKFWTANVGRAAMSIQIIPGVVYGCVLLWTEFHWQQENYGGWYIEGDDLDFIVRYYTVGFVGQAMLTASITCIYAVILITFRLKYKSTIQPERNEIMQRVVIEKQTHEKRLVYISMIVCTLEIINFVYYWYFFVINPDVESRIFYLVFHALNDLYAATPPYLLIVFSTPFRLKVKQFIGCVKYSVLHALSTT